MRNDTEVESGWWNWWDVWLKVLGSRTVALVGTGQCWTFEMLNGVGLARQ
jgi:hypothetical protein